VGDGWLDRTVLHEDTRLGSVTEIRRRPGTGELAIVGTRAAAFLLPGQAAQRLVQFRDEAGEVQLLEWPGGGARYLDRGGGGWQTGALIGEDGGQLWQPERGFGMNDMAGGDLNGDGQPEFAVGYNGGGGVHLVDSTGRPIWRQDDGNVWHVEIVDTDGDGRPEIVHSNAGGQVTVRDATGKVLRRAQTEGYFSQFSLVQWPPGRTGLLHAGDEMTRVIDFDGQVRSRFQTPDTSFLADAHGALARLGGGDHLVVAEFQSNWERTQLFVFDQAGALRYREVVAGKCAAVAASDPNGFLVGCDGRVYRYVPRS
jgi:hypothetical protein